eukprot:5174481-Alexandrium_andersonii.AAC.1
MRTPYTFPGTESAKSLRQIDCASAAQPAEERASATEDAIGVTASLLPRQDTNTHTHTHTDTGQPNALA